MGREIIYSTEWSREFLKSKTAEEAAALLLPAAEEGATYVHIQNSPVSTITLDLPPIFAGRMPPYSLTDLSGGPMASVVSFPPGNKIRVDFNSTETFRIELN